MFVRFLYYIFWAFTTKCDMHRYECSVLNNLVLTANQVHNLFFCSIILHQTDKLSMRWCFSMDLINVEFLSVLVLRR
jgi:hypothetical protein